MYSKVAANMLWLLDLSSKGWPYKIISSRLVVAIKQRLFSWRIVSMVSNKASLCRLKRVQLIKKWRESSTPVLQTHLSEGVSAKLCLFLWKRKWLKPTRNWKKCLKSWVSSRAKLVKSLHIWTFWKNCWLTIPQKIKWFDLKDNIHVFHLTPGILCDHYPCWFGQRVALKTVLHVVRKFPCIYVLLSVFP